MTAAVEVTSLSRREEMEAKLASLHEEQQKAVKAGGKYIARHHERGKLTARERIELLIDEGSAFLELMPLAGWGSDFAVGASIVTVAPFVNRSVAMPSTSASVPAPSLEFTAVGRSEPAHLQFSAWISVATGR